MTILLLCGIISFHPQTHRPIRVCYAASVLRHPGHSRLATLV